MSKKNSGCQDIRSFFSGSKKTEDEPSPRPKPKPKKRVISSDEEDFKEKTPQKRSKAKEKKKSGFLSDSDDEVVAKKKNDKPPESKYVDVEELFGNKPIKRINGPKIERKAPQVENTEGNTKKKSKKSSKKSSTSEKESSSKNELAFHDDPEFERTLEQLDITSFEKAYSASVKSTSNSSSKVKTPEKKDPKPLKTINGSDKKRKMDDKEETSKKLKPSNNSPKKSPVKKSLSKDKKESGEKSKPVEKVNLKKLKKKEERSYEIEIEKKASPKKKKEKDPYEQVAEKIKQQFAMYQNYLSRGGARNPGSKEIPEGAELCLAGLSFLITGVLDSLERSEADELVKKYGGRTVQTVSKKLNYLVVGDQAGPAKLEKATSLGVQKISEDDLLDLIRTRSAGKTTDVAPPKKKLKVKAEDEIKKSPAKKETLVKKTPEKKVKIEKEEKPSTSTFLPKESKSEIQKSSSGDNVEALVEKHRPQKMAKLIGQQGDKSNANKLKKWLENWHSNRLKKDVKKPTPWAKNDDGAFFKAALLSGPPGIGKTTTAYVVCKELNLDLIEFNASDTRSKRLLKDEVSDLLKNKTLKGYFSTESEIEKTVKNHVLLMDEVDGMAGNEDRGGLQELIALIKSTSIPILCICNDRSDPKMKTLSNYIYDLKFAKPQIKQIMAAMKTICLRENIQISDENLARLIESTNQDIRQVINHLALLSASRKTDTDGSNEKKGNKDLRLGPWEVIRKVFSCDEHKKMSIHDRSDLFFQDYSIGPLFVQENYLSVTPKAPLSEHLERIALTAESLALGDIVGNQIRKDSAWSLLPTQAMFASVFPGYHMSGHTSAEMKFPSWLGRYSRGSKFKRLLQELSGHTRTITGVSKEAITLDYLKPLRNKIVRPLALKEMEGIEEAVEAMNTYHLVREDLDSLNEVSLWPGDKNPMDSVDSKVKAAFTRSFNKNSAAYSYSAGGVSKKKSKVQDEEFINNEEVESESEKEDDNIENDRIIKKKASKATAEKPKEPSKRGRGRGKAK